MLFKFIPTKSSKYYYRFILAMLFMFGGFIISCISVLASGYFQINAIHKEFAKSAQSTLASKKHFLRERISYFKNNLIAVDKTSEFSTFIQSDLTNNTHAKRHVKEIMLTLTYANPNIMQFRFIDMSGHEIIRIDRNATGEEPYEIDKKLLQDKSQHYYFKKAQNTPEGEVWFSKIDLNIEHGEIIEPIVPTLRVAKPYFLNGDFRGILIINIFMTNILDQLMKSELFNVVIIDKDSYLLTSSYKDDKEWTRYLKKENSGINHNWDNSILNFLLQQKKFSIDLSDTITNGEGLQIVIEEKTEKIMEYINDIVNYMLVMGIIIFSISIPVVMLLSRYPLKLHDKLEILKNDLEKQLNIIDKYVYMASTDSNGVITDVSMAYTQLTGYSKEEMIGNDFRKLRDPNIPKSFYKQMWATILSGKDWSGEIKNINKAGETFFLKTHITPKTKNGKIVGFTSIRENITNQKQIEEISMRDELTQAYNRRFFNQMFSKELKRAKRKGEIFSIAMFDIDFFKKYNDTYGHVKGDEVLQKVVLEISSKLQRPSDYLFRVGGEEFMIIYTDTQSLKEAEKFSLEIVKAVESINLEHKTSECANVLTISMGLLNVTPKCNMDEDTILKVIDDLLYRAKDRGRNQLVSQEC